MGVPSHCSVEQVRILPTSQAGGDRDPASHLTAPPVPGSARAQPALSPLSPRGVKIARSKFERPIPVTRAFVAERQRCAIGLRDLRNLIAQTANPRQQSTENP